MSSLKGKTAFVSGGTRGIGLAIAKRLASEGADIMVAGSSEANCAARPGPSLRSRTAGLRLMPPICERLKAARQCLTRIAGCLVAAISLFTAPVRQGVACSRTRMMPISLTGLR